MGTRSHDRPSANRGSSELGAEATICSSLSSDLAKLRSTLVTSCTSRPIGQHTAVRTPLATVCNIVY